MLLLFAWISAVASQGCTTLREGRVEPPPEVREEASSVCTVPVEPDGELTLVLDGIDWDDWERQCEALMPFLSPDPPPFDGRTAVAIETLLEETGYFRTAICEIEMVGAELVCDLTPQPIIKEISIRGRLPVGVLREDLKRRLLVAPGSLLVDEERLFESQQERLVLFLERDGFFGSEATLSAIPVGGAEPNLGVVLDVELEVGRTVNLRDIAVLGEHPLEKGEVESTIRHFGLLRFFERRFRPEVFQQDMDDLTLELQERGYPEARVTGRWTLDPDEDFVDVEVTIDAGPKLVLHFVGNEALSDRRLSGLATFAEGGIIDETEVLRTTAAIEEEYQAAGYPDVEVTSFSDQPEPRTVEIVFDIDEGRRAKIRSVRYEGNETISSRRIRREAEVRTRRSRFIFRERWVDSVAAADERSIEELYEKRGHGAAEVRAERIDRPDGDIDVTFHVLEGPRREVRALTIAGLPGDIDAAALEERLEMRPEEPYIEGREDRDRDEILATLATEGYPMARAVTSIDAPPADEGGPVIIEHQFDPGTKAIVGGFLVRGNFRTRVSLIREQLELAPGETLDLVTLGEARRRLRGLGAFTSIEIQPVGLWRDEPETWQVVAVQEREGRTGDLVASYATDEGFSVGGDFRDRNLFGRAIHLDLRLRLGDLPGLIHPALRIGRSDRVDANVRAPRLFGLPFDTDGSIFYRFEGQDDFLEERLGIGSGISRQLLSREDCRYCPDLVAQLRYEVTAGRFEIAGEEVEPDDDPRALFDAPLANIGRIGPVVLADRRDSFVDPRRGWSAEGRLELAHSWLSPLPDGHNFYRALLEGRGYLNLGAPWERPLGGDRVLGGPVVVAAASGLGLARPLGREPGLPDSEGLYYGGDYSVRGLAPYASAIAFPGASYRMTGSVELRWYAAQNVLFGSFQLAGFVDAASVSYRASEIFEEPAVSVGPLIRYLTPVGPLSLGWGVAVVRPEAISGPRPDLIPERGRLHLTFGYSF